MKAVIGMKLVKPTRSGRQYVTKSIVCKRDEAVNTVNDFIYQRVNDEKMIRVEKFFVTLFTREGREDVSWTYSPSYR